MALIFASGDEVSHSYKRFNEDKFGWAADRFWMMDGATGLADHPTFHAESDAYWLVERYHSYFEQNDPNGRDLRDYIKEAMASIVRSIGDKAALDSIPAFALPTAGLFLATLDRGRLQYLQLGDCKCLLFTHGQLHLLGQSRLEQLDKAVVQRMKELQAAGVREFANVWNVLLPTLKNNRALANQEGGYWILGFDPRAADNAFRGEVEISNGDLLLAMTDGFTRLFDVFGSAPGDLLAQVQHGARLDQLLDSLRQNELADPECLSFPRIKCHDDASALLLSVVSGRE
jgi:serine/threonine protein phosphatase PrpC